MKKLIKISLTISALFVVSLFLIILISEWTIIRNSRKYTFDCVEQVPENHTVLVLGTSPYLVNGRRNLFFVYRMQAAQQLYEAGKARNFIVSGDNSRHTYNEPQAMQESLIALGIPAEIIYLDYAGFRTLDSVIRTYKIFGQDTFIIVSQKFHNERAVYIARKHGLNAYAYNSRSISRRYSMKTFIRERFARVKVFVDILLNKEPKFLGEPIEIGNLKKYHTDAESSSAVSVYPNR